MQLFILMGPIIRFYLFIFVQFLTLKNKHQFLGLFIYLFRPNVISKDARTSAFILSYLAEGFSKWLHITLKLPIFLIGPFMNRPDGPICRSLKVPSL